MHVLVPVDERGPAAQRLDEAAVLGVELGMDVAVVDTAAQDRQCQRAERRQPAFRRQARLAGDGWLVGQGKMQPDRGTVADRLDARRLPFPFRKAGHATGTRQAAAIEQFEDRRGNPGRQAVVVGDQADAPRHVPDAPGGLSETSPRTTSRTM